MKSDRIRKVDELVILNAVLLALDGNGEDAVLNDQFDVIFGGSRSFVHNAVRAIVFFTLYAHRWGTRRSSIEGTTTPGCQRREFATQRTLLQVWRSVDESGSDVAHAHGLRRPLAASCMLDLRVHARPTWLERCAESIGASPHCGPGAAVFVPRLMWSSTLTVVVRRWAAGSTLTTEPVRVGRELTVREMMAQCQDGAAGDPPTVFMDSGGIHDPWPLFPDMIEMCDLDQPLSVLKQLGFARFTLCPSDDDSCRNDLIVNAPTKPAPKRMLTSVKEKNAKNRKLQAKRVTVMYDKRILIVDPTRSADLPSFTTITDALEVTRVPIGLQMTAFKVFAGR